MAIGDNEDAPRQNRKIVTGEIFCLGADTET